jgi:hypothetical protein
MFLVKKQIRKKVFLYTSNISIVSTKDDFCFAPDFQK